MSISTAGLERYRSPSQLVRVATEEWGERNLYCACCNSPELESLPTNTPASDFICPRCASRFQLKSQSNPFRHKVTDSAYSKMCAAIQTGQTPNLLLLHYAPTRWEVCRLLLVPSFALSLSCIEKRRPLAPTARRAGWVGCNIVLTSIPSDARIDMVADRRAIAPREVRKRYARLRPLAKISTASRGWTLDVLNLLRSLDRAEFDLRTAYGMEAELGRMHPGNRHVRAKIRQQLQVLRDAGFVRFLGWGHYRLL